MTTVEPLAVTADLITMAMRQVGAVQWEGVCECPHGRVTTTTLLDQPAALDPLAVVQSLRANHDRSIVCTCTYAPPTQLASIVFNTASGITNGQLRLIPQASANTPAGNFYFGPPTTCQRLGCYQLDLTLVLDKPPQAVRGFAHIMLDRVVIATTSTQAPTAGLLPSPPPPPTSVLVSTMTTIHPGQFVLAAYENIAGPPIAVTAATFTLGAIWVP